MPDHTPTPPIDRYTMPRDIPDAAFWTANGTAAEAEPQSTPTLRYRHWTRAKQAAFLREYARSKSVTHAARAVGMGRQSAYKLRARMAGSAFAEAWERIAAAPRGVFVSESVTRPMCRPDGAKLLRNRPSPGRHFG